MNRFFLRLANVYTEQLFTNDIREKIKLFVYVQRDCNLEDYDTVKAR